jgi:methyltransferase (TIGR00027 family)
MLHTEPQHPISTPLLAGAHALFRMRETQRRGPRILVDEYAARLADPHPLLRAMGFALPSLMQTLDELQTAHCVRHRSIDELILRALTDGYRQVVVVGAGYDMRPSRLPLGDTRWYELERAAILEAKRKRLGRAQVRPYEAAAVELEEQPIGPALDRTSFDPDWDTLFVLEGLAHSLDPQRFVALLGECARGRGRRRVVLSFLRGEHAPEAEPRLQSLLKLLDEQPRVSFLPEHLAALCARHKLLEFRSWTYEEQVAELAPEAKGRAVGVAHDVAQLQRVP